MGNGSLVESKPAYKESLVAEILASVATALVYTTDSILALISSWSDSTFAFLARLSETIEMIPSLIDSVLATDFLTFYSAFNLAFSTRLSASSSTSFCISSADAFLSFFFSFS